MGEMADIAIDRGLEEDCFGGMLVCFSAFLGSCLIGASFNIRQDKF